MWLELLLTAFLLWVFWSNIRKPENYPPGPWGLPLLGHIPLKMMKIRSTLSNLRKKYGEVFSWRIGSKVFVVLCEYKIIKEALQSQAFANRPRMSGLSLLENGNDLGVIATNGVHWHGIRRFMLRHLRDLGMGKSKIVSAMQFEASEFTKVMKQQAGKAAPIPKALSPAIINILWQMIASERYELDDEKIILFDNLIHEAQQSFAGGLIVDLFPWLEKIVPSSLLNKVTKQDVKINLSNRLKEYFKVSIDGHIKSLDVNNPRDFIDEYLIEMDKQKSDPNSTMSYDDLMGCLADLFLGGLETTSLTICFALFYLANFPEVQDKIHKEIDQVLPNETPVTMEDKIKLPYVDAFINEVLRYSSLATYGVIRSVFEDTKIGGYIIPKDAFVMPSIGEIHFDPKYFDSPKEFRPERFLNSNGKLEIPKEGFFPFGIGKRQCLGESLTRMQLFIFLVTILQQFKFSPPLGKKIDIRPKDIPLTNLPRQEQDIMITARK